MSPAGRERRGGYVLLETVGGVIVLMIALAVTVRLIGWVAAERRDAGRRQSATLEAANVMERLAVRRWDDLTAGTLGDLTLGPEAREILPDGRLGVQLAEKDGLKRITVEVRWRGRGGKDEAPVRLTAWFAQAGEVRP